MKRAQFFILFAIFVLSLPFSYGGCGGGNGGNNSSDVAIEWHDPYPGPGDPIVTYRYNGGILVGMLFYKDFAVLRNSNTIEITATVEDGSVPPGILDEHTEYLGVTEGIEYEIVVDVDVANLRLCNPNDFDYMVFSSPCTSSTSEILISPIFDAGEFRCVGSYTIQEIRFTPESVRFKNNLVCGIDSFWADLDICGVALDSNSGFWSSCETAMPGTCSWHLSASPAGCEPLNISGTIDLDSDCVYSFVLGLDGSEVVLSVIDECPGNCSTPTPSLSGATSISLIELQIENDGFMTVQ